MPEINDLYRRVRKHPMYIKENGKVSSAIYSDKKGVSVDIDDGRELDTIIKVEEDLHVFYNKPLLEEDPEGPYKLVAIAAVSKNVCDEKEVLIELEPVENNPYHAILKKSAEKIDLTSSQKKYLADRTRVIKSYDKNLIVENK